MITLSDLNLETMPITELGELLIQAKKAYYTGGKPIMDDHTYDTLEELLRKKNPYHRIFLTVGNPNFDTGFPKKKHAMPMGSQNKVTSYEELVHYFELKKIPTDTKFVVQPKCDGLSLEIEYKEGRVVDAITRGDGEIGDVITQNVVKMQNFKESLNDKFTGSVRCEIIVTYSDFKILNQLAKGDELTRSPEMIYSNPRNAASGISQRLDSKYSELCTLEAVSIFSQQKRFSTEIEKIDYLKKLGIKPVETFVAANYQEIENIFQNFFEKDRQDYPFDIDGLVIKIDDIDLQNRLGERDKRPKGQVAYKFPAQSTQTTIKSITWQVGPLGTLTPVAQVDPIEVSGAIITFASLANYDLVKEKNINIGDIVQISRRGDVIPHIEEVITKVTPGHITAPSACPSCGTPLVVEQKFVKCPNIRNCPAQILGALRLFCDTLEIKGISDKTIEKFYKVGKVRLPGDFYDLQISDFIDLEGLGEKSGKNIVTQIQAKRNLSLVQVFDAAIIPNFSAKRIKQLIAAGFDTSEKILRLQVSDLEGIPGFQKTLARKIVEGIQARRDFVESILSQVVLRESRIQDPESKLSGLSFAITGDLSVPRKELEKLIEDNGGKIVTSVSKNTNYLISNETESTSSKFTNAQKLGIPIISEDDFYKLTNQ